MASIETVIPPTPTRPLVPEAIELVNRMMRLRGGATPTVIIRDRVLKSDIDELDYDLTHVIFVATKEWLSVAKAAAARCKQVAASTMTNTSRHVASTPSQLTQAGGCASSTFSSTSCGTFSTRSCGAT